MVILSTACTVLFAILGISLTYIAMCSKMAVIMMATMISAWKLGVMCVALFSGLS